MPATSKPLQLCGKRLNGVFGSFAASAETRLAVGSVLLPDSELAGSVAFASCLRVACAPSFADAAESVVSPAQPPKQATTHTTARVLLALSIDVSLEPPLMQLRVPGPQCAHAEVECRARMNVASQHCVDAV